MTVLTSPSHSGAYLTVAEVAEELRCSEPTIRRRIRDGELPAVKLGAGRNAAIRIPCAGLDAWLWPDSKEIPQLVKLGVG
jgi:excisionase family DNA binding protein